MSAFNINEYILVRDKDGQMKYYKDGRLFSVEEIDRLSMGKVKDEVGSMGYGNAGTGNLELGTREKETGTGEKVKATGDLRLATGEKEKEKIMPIAKREVGSAVPAVSEKPLVKIMPIADRSEKRAGTGEGTGTGNLELGTREEETGNLELGTREEETGNLKLETGEKEFGTRKQELGTGEKEKATGKNDFELEKLPAQENHSANRAVEQKLVEEKIQHLIDKLKIQFNDPEIKRRFSNILTTYFRGIRGTREIEYALTLPKVSGGLELTPEKVALIMPILKVLAEDLEKKRFEAVVKHHVEPVIDLKHRLEPPPPAKAEDVAPKNFVSAPPVKASVPMPAKVQQPVRPSVVKPLVNQTAPILAQAKKIEAPARPKLMGPLEELEYMDAENFRLLGRNIEECKNEVMERIALLADQGLVKKIQGIKAWKKSPLMKMYLDLSWRGLTERKTIEQLIFADQAANRETLTLSEYEAVNDLNRQMKY